MTVTIPDTDIDNDGACVGPELGCLDCREVARTRYGMGPRAYTTALVTGCCLEEITHWRI